MTFAHAPAGYLALRFTERFWNKKKIFKKKQRLALYIIGILFAIFPDVDLFYHYFYSAEISHRQYPSHGIVIYSVLFLLIYLVGLIAKKKFIKSIAWVMLIGVSTHLFLDTIASGIAVFAPLSTYMYGLRKYSFIRDHYIGANMFLVNYALELLIIISAFVVFLWDYIKEMLYRQIMIGVAIVLFIFGFSTLFYINNHIYNGGHFDSYFQDNDHDGIINSGDFDIDGDGILNINDNDASGNGVPNQVKIKEASDLMNGKWYDFTEDGYGELLSRWGFLTNTDIVRKAYEGADIYFDNEFIKDYKNNPNDYVGIPEDPKFSKRAENIYAFSKHNNRLIDGKDLQIGDIVFFNNNFVALVSSVDKSGKASIIIGERGKMIYEQNLDALGDKFGGVKDYGRIVK